MSDTVNNADRVWFQHYTSWTAREIELDNSTTLTSVFHKAAKDYATRTAYRFFGKKTSYADYGVKVRTAAAGLQDLGVKAGDNVAIVSPNCPQALIAFYAVLSVGAVPVLHNPLYTAAELNAPFKDHAAKVAFFWDKTAATADELRRTTPLDTVIAITMPEEMPLKMQLLLRLPVKAAKESRAKLTSAAPNALPWKKFMARGAKNAKSTFTPHPAEPGDAALILYTSGTTGEPKGAVLSHQNLLANLLQGIEWVEGLGKGDEPELMMAALPIFHAYGLTMNITMAPFIGGEIILLPSPEMDLILGEIKQNTPSWLPGVPTLYEKIMDGAEKEGISLAGIRNSFSGASALPAATVQRWEKLTGGRIIEGYGLTETAPIIVGNPMGHGREGYIGVPFPSTDIRIANPENLDETQPAGEPGELMARGPQVFKGYLNKPKATTDAFHNDWFRTGDMAVMEEDGFIRIASRIKEMIITGGFNVYPGEVEEAVASHKDIAQASVVGLPRKDGSEDVVAAVVLAEGASLRFEQPTGADTEELRAFTAKQLTAYKVPRKVFVFDELPADQMGKIRRREVLDQVMERTES